MRRSFVVAIVVAVLGALASSAAVASAPTQCGLSFTVRPGVGSTLVTNVRVRGVTCAKAHFAIGRYEHSQRHTVTFSVSGKPFTCKRIGIGDPELGLSAVNCRRGSQTVSWRAAFGI